MHGGYELMKKSNVVLDSDFNLNVKRGITMMNSTTFFYSGKRWYGCRYVISTSENVEYMRI